MPTYDGPIIDCDVHHNPRNEEEVVERLDKRWRDFVNAPLLEAGPVASMSAAIYNNQNGFDSGGRRLRTLAARVNFAHTRGGVNKRLDSYPEAGGAPASDYETLRVQLLDPFRIEYAILAHDFVIGYAAIQNPDFADALVRAVNDWAVDTWLSIPDPRLLGVIFVPMQLPEAGVAEIRRLAGHPLMVEARLPFNTLGKPFGHPLYHPIYAAASEAHLPISFHVNGGENVMGLGHNNGAGISNSFFEFATLNPQPALNHLASFITHGVFEKFPDLRVLLVETGTAWIPSFLWALDSQYKNLRRESSWVKKLPSEYFREHVRVTTQPLEVTEKSVGRFVDLMEAFGGMEDILCFSSDYPHWDFDDPRHIASWLPASWHRKVFFDNAASIYSGRLAMKARATETARVGLKPEPV